ncbi:DinB family protein [Lutibacter sp. TH_r2]|uniref:DinB family protein n=1 Tax=Lutibacter sp. TH_r2 TaxID=3082083 RepID=UPI0029534EAE|nr:DinB family protein [Lutibacter sp. TH_r2]MDV7186248.1 DinB family protein [Lutibacter sp. TH_r2]
MTSKFDVLKKSRILTLKVIEGLTVKQLNIIPKGFNNNIAWNIGHLVVTQQLLCYKLSGLECNVSDEMIANFGKGSAPSYTVSEEEFNTFKKLLVELPILLEEDYTKGIFKNYADYTTSVNITLTNIEEAISFNNYHEGIHLGIILQLKKLV